MSLAFGMGISACGSSSGGTKDDNNGGGGGTTAGNTGGTGGATKASTVEGLGGSFVSNRDSSSTAKCAMEGGRDAAALKECIKSYHDTVRECYKSALVGDETLKGQVRIKFTILANGSTDDVGMVSSTVEDGEFEKCILDAANKWMFPAGTGKLQVQYPFKFRSVTEE